LTDISNHYFTKEIYEKRKWDSYLKLIRNI